MNLTHAIHDARRLKIRLLNPRYYRMLRDRRTGAAAADYYRCFDETRSIFVHIPKTGGVSLTKSLYGSRAGRHAPLSTFQVVFPASAFYRYYKFAFVRNPWDRLYSAYRYLKSGAMGEPHDLAWIEKNMSDVKDFEDFVLNFLPRPEIRSFVHFRTQESFLRNTVTGKVGVDFVGRFETLEQDFATAANRIGRDTALPHLNKSKISGRYREAYSAGMREVAERIYGADASTFDYKF